jgi:hypothetical protein
MSGAFSLVFLQTVVGGFATLIFAPPGLLGRGFYRFMGGLYAVLFGLALWIESQAFETVGGVARWGTAYAALVGAYAILTWTPLIGVGYLLVALATPCGFAFLWNLAAKTAFLYGLEGVARGMWLADIALSSVLLGSATTAMLFGHWYLTTPDLSTRYLRCLNAVVIVALAASAMLFGASLAVNWATLRELGFLTVVSFGGVFLWGRTLVGFGAVGVCVGLTWFCLREDSTQAATGFLYLVVLFLLMGELLSCFLTAQTRLPL